MQISNCSSTLDEKYRDVTALNDMWFEKIHIKQSTFDLRCFQFLLFTLNYHRHRYVVCFKYMLVCKCSQYIAVHRSLILELQVWDDY